ncbi:MAG: CBS domain-containing protein [Candidatus Omnitrophica bacterium]|nr:CBS domain-containing protein [Candidatus Omnitrophota bacterium]
MENLHKLLLKDIMVKEPFTIDIDDPFGKVWEMFRAHGIRHLPVIDDKGTLRGIVTQRDLYRTASPRKTMEGELVYDKADLDKHILKYVMTKKVVSLSPDQTLKNAVDLMVNSKYGCIPIVDSNKCLVGIVTQVDVLKVIAEYAT